MAVSHENLARGGDLGRFLPVVIWACAAGGLVLLILNLVGLAIPLRAPDLRDGYADFSSPEIMPIDRVEARLEELRPLRQSDPPGYVAAVNRVFSEAIAHIREEDIAARGFDYYHMRVPAWENFILYTLSYLKPDTYRDYEFCSYEKALARGTGRCGQQTTAVVGFLHQQGYETGIMVLPGHVAGTVKVAPDTWHIIDPDYGVTTPYSIDQLQADPSLAEPFYGPLADKIGIEGTFGGPITVAYGGPEVRWARVCPIERAAYIAKWALPVALMIPLVGWALWRRRRS